MHISDYNMYLLQSSIHWYFSFRFGDCSMLMHAKFGVKLSVHP